MAIKVFPGVKLGDCCSKGRRDLAPALYTESKHSRSDGTGFHCEHLSDGGMGNRLKNVMEYDA